MTLKEGVTLRPAAGPHEMPQLTVAETVEKPSIRVGVVSGLGYKNLRGDLERISRYLNGLPVPHEIVREPRDVAQALDDFEAQGIDLVVVSGGDGTISMVATHLLNRGTSIPLLAVLEGGRTNMTARDVGVRGDQIKRLHRLLTWAEKGGKTGQIVDRPVMGVGVAGARPECGFFVGGGAIYQGSLETWKFRDRSRLPGMRTGMGTASSVVRLIVSHLATRGAFDPSRMRMAVGDRILDEESWCVMFATTLDRLAFGICPFWAEGPGRIRMTAIAAEHRHLLRAGLSGIRGRQNRHNSPGLGYHSFNSDSLELDIDDGITLDGQIIRHKGPGLRIGLAGSLKFLRL